MPNAFWVEHIEKGKIYLSPSEAKHLKVLRAKTGDLLTGLDGKGNIYRFQLENIGKRETTGRLLSVEHVNRNEQKLIVLVATTKWPRLRLVMEKAVELGIDRIELFNSKHSVARASKDKSDKFISVMREASKQCLNPYLPELQIIDSADKIALNNATNFLLDFYGKPFQSFSSKIATSRSVRILVGPEGGFSKNELELFQRFSSVVSLGKRILRVETAVIVSVSFVSLLMGRF
ncbi:hypothetical protein AT15_06095 [Kosmotoga arenicorallina S304]|uniref:Ribosomal RNA small subunit methyltransferase E n=1 Tax=Kosmotoga arenicorallina S304 TaxID=1453497 RepID=A0A176K3H5_9BACT|nr:RsmE family RNA methyltransferase [Kosmotoga arenicorallina]OAA31642.1 hypothetical protein AT15_06095 [Kosmotoga arenicorallina S304]